MDQNFAMNPHGGSNGPFWPACVDADAAARFLGWVNSTAMQGVDDRARRRAAANPSLAVPTVTREP